MLIRLSVVIVSQYGSLCYTLETNINIIFQVVLMVKNLPANVEDSRDAGSIPWLARSPGVENGNPLQYSCLENSRDRRALWATVHGVEKNRTWLSIYTYIPKLRKETVKHFHNLFLIVNYSNSIYWLIAVTGHVRAHRAQKDCKTHPSPLGVKSVQLWGESAVTHYTCKHSASSRSAVTVMLWTPRREGLGPCCSLLFFHCLAKCWAQSRFSWALWHIDYIK